MRPEELLPTNLTLSIGSRVPPAVTSTLQPRRLACRRAARRGSPCSTARPARARRAPARRRRAPARARPGARRPPRPSRPARPTPGSTTITPRSRSVLQVGLRRRVLVHAVVHRRRDHQRTGGRERAAAQQVVGEAAGELGDRVRPSAGAIRYTSALATSSRWLSGSCVGGGWPGNAPRAGRARTRCSSTGAPVSAANDASPTKRWLAGVCTTRTACPVGGRQAHELERLVRGDAAADAEQDPGHD